jgi:two-component system response regulator DegU
VFNKGPLTKVFDYTALNGDSPIMSAYVVIVKGIYGSLWKFMSENKIKIFICSQQSLFRQGIECSLSLIEDIEIYKATEINDEVLSTMDNLPPDVAVVDIDAPDGGGLATCLHLKRSLPNIGIIAFTSNYNDVQLFEAIRVQVAACLSKEATAGQLIGTVRRVARGEHPINESLVTHPILADQVLRKFQELSRRKETRPFVSALTKKEMEILDYIAQGLQNKQIAIQLEISEQTIKNHVTSILRKLNANARTEAVIVALRQGLISIK